MKKVIVIILWLIIVSTDWSKPQNISVSSEDEKFVHNDVKAINISSKVKFKQTHPFANFCNEYQRIAIFYQIECGIPVSVQLAQAIVESGGGRSDLALKTNNLFGMKYYKSLYSGSYWTSPNGEKWRKYDSIEDSFRDHAEFLHKFYPNAIGKDWEYWVGTCKGYGGMGYWKHIGDVIELYQLWRYDELVKDYQRSQENRAYNV